MTSGQRIYFDNAATSWPKPEAVYTAVDNFQRSLGSAAGRGGYATAVEVNQKMDRARQSVARLLGAASADRIIFLQNGTDALNWAIHGIVRPGDHVVTTAAEHNSVLRPLAWLAKTSGLQVTYVGCNSHGYVSPDDIRAAMLPTTRLVVVTHASNVTGAIQPVDDIAAIAHGHGAKILIDAAQSVGHVEMCWRDVAWDLIACSGHKGLLGPLGTGLLYLAPGIEEELRPARQGGTGTDSHSELPPLTLPDRHEVGNPNVPGILGLGAAADYLLTAEHHAASLMSPQLRTEELLVELARVPGLKVFGPPIGLPRTPVVSFQLQGYAPHEVASLLDSAARIEVRAGLHCAPRIHAALGTDREGGTVRVSLGCFNTADEVSVLLEILRSLTGG